MSSGQMATSLRNITVVFSGENRSGLSRRGFSARFRSAASLGMRSPWLGSMGLETRWYCTPRAARAGIREERTSGVPSAELPSTMERAQLEGPRKRIVVRRVPSRRGRMGRDWRRLRAKKKVVAVGEEALGIKGS